MNTGSRFKDSDTASFAAGQYVKRFDSVPRTRANIALDRLDAATGLVDLRQPPGNRFEKLQGDREGQYSIRINDRWRVCFEWPDGDPQPSRIEIVDYHR